MLDDVVADFLDYLRRAALPRPFLPTYEREARRFLSAFPDRRPEQVDHDDVDAYLGAAQAAGATEQQIRDYKVVAEAVVWFLKQRAPSLPPPRLPEPPRPSPGPQTAQSAPPPPGKGRRQHKRVAFIRDVMIHGLGYCRCSDLSRGGMFLETHMNVGVGSELDVTFRIHPDRPEAVSARVRVVYEHPQVGAGLMFISLSEDSQDQIDEFVASRPESERVG